MKSDTCREAISRYAYLFVIIMAVLQGVILYCESDYGIRRIINLPASVAYLPALLAILVPSVSSFLISGLKSAGFYISLVLTVLLVCWTHYWYLGSIEITGNSDQIIVTIILIALLFCLLPWIQYRLTTGRYNPGFTFLVSHYVRNAVLGAVACVIGLIVMGIIKIAVYLFSIVNFEYLSHLLDDGLFYWLGFCLGFNISLVFMRGLLTFPVYKITAYAARVLLPVLNIIAVIFVAGLLISAASSVTVNGLGSSVMIWFLALNVILLNLVYDNESGQFTLRSWFKYLLVCGILILNILTVMSLYGILTRVNQYSWTVERLYAFSAALFFTLLILAYSAAIIFRRSHLTGTISKAGLLTLAAGLFLINSPVADFNRIAAGSILAGVESGKLKVDSDLKYTLSRMGRQGEKVLDILKVSPQYSTELERSPYEQRETVTLKEVLLIAKNSPALPDSWWTGKPDFPDSWHCKQEKTESECLGFMADVNKDGEDDVVACYYEPLRTSFSCYVWQRITVVTEEGTEMDEWRQVDSQESESMSSELRKTNWNKLKEGRFLLKTKEWQQIDVQE